MCGIVGYVGARSPVEILLQGLKRLEYRGYDSAGVAWREGAGAVRCVRAVGNLNALEVVLSERRTEPSSPVAVAELCTGIGHTRWATHGCVTERNAHPHEDGSGRVRIVLNGIIENYLELRRRLAAESIECVSETDAEVVAHLIALHYGTDLTEAVRRTSRELSGHYAFVAMCEDEPEVLVGIRRECPLVIGMGDGEQFIASSAAAFMAHTRDVAVLHDGEIARLRPSEVTVFDGGGAARSIEPTVADWNDEAGEKDGFETFMLKEIHQQGQAIKETLSGNSPGAPAWLSDAQLSRVKRIAIVACGSSYHAGLAGRMAIERWARVPVDVDIASEFRYRDPIVGADTLVLGITQSGETADTLAAMRLARERGATVVAVTNARGSQATREADAVLYTRAGVEIGVAATKTFVAQVVLLYAFALRVARLKQAASTARLEHLQEEIDALPGQVDMVVRSLDGSVREIAEQLACSPFFLFLGRLAGLPVALEGALKLKEISYVPTDAYPAGEMKHGPIALLSSETPVVCVAIEDQVLPKLLSNLSEVRARGAPVFAVAGEGCKEIAEHAEHIVYIPRCDPLLQIVLSVVPLQLFAHHLARKRGLNVDQPRNLAKTVTVE